MNDREPLTFCILCGDATYNRGDRANLAAQLDLLADQFPDCRIIIDSYRPEVDARWYPRAEVLFRHHFPGPRMIRAIRDANIVVWGGGALLADNASIVKVPYWLVIMAFIRFILRKPYMVWAHGLVLNRRWSRALAGWTFRWAEAVAVRDRGSYDLTHRSGHGTTPVYLTADPAVLSEPGEAEEGLDLLRSLRLDPEKSPIFAFCHTFCAQHYDAADWIPYMIAGPLGLRKRRGAERIERLIEAMRRFIDRLMDAYSCQFLLLPTYPAPWENDSIHFRELASRISRKDRVAILEKDDIPPKHYHAMWRHFSFVATTPLHHSILTVTAGKPCLNIYYEEKGRNFFEALELGNQLLAIERFTAKDGVDEAFEKVNCLLRDWDLIRPVMLEKLEESRIRARANAEILGEVLSAGAFHK